MENQYVVVKAPLHEGHVKDSEQQRQQQQLPTSIKPGQQGLWDMMGDEDSASDLEEAEQQQRLAEEVLGMIDDDEDSATDLEEAEQQQPLAPNEREPREWWQVEDSGHGLDTDLEAQQVFTPEEQTYLETFLQDVSEEDYGQGSATDLNEQPWDVSLNRLSSTRFLNFVCYRKQLLLQEALEAEVYVHGLDADIEVPTANVQQQFEPPPAPPPTPVTPMCSLEDGLVPSDTGGDRVVNCLVAMHPTESILTM
ncbi:hypothetical protein FRB95_010090 [Tulasnella sp. JGI-2019a]|nr:hypothetical protein FRB95_010090 [Tulasnella sp. JGI-2019a]